LEFIFVAAQNERDIYSLRLEAGGGQLLTVTTVWDSSQLPPALINYPGVPLIVLDRERFVTLEDLWKVLHPDQTWNREEYEADAENLRPLLLRLWQEIRDLGFSVVEETLRILNPQDPLRTLFEAAMEGVIFDRPPPQKMKAHTGKSIPGELEFSRDKVLEFLGERGLLSQTMESYRFRAEQESMAREVCDALEQEEFLLAEAGTGVGKTLAYLVPSIYWASSTGQKVVVSTRTRALQKQLAEKDLPMLSQVLPFGFNWQVAYGRENYLCLARWYGIRYTYEELSVQERRLLAGLNIWLAAGGNGQRQELRWDNQEAAIWKRIGVQRHGCSGNMCPWQYRCYFFSARRELHNCHLIVVNHALLLSDMAIEGRILPAYKHLIIDEAHNFDRTAFEKLGISFTASEGLQLLARLAEKRDRIDRGYLAGLKARHPNIREGIAQAVGKIDLVRQSIRGLAQVSISDSRGIAGTRRIRPGMEEADDYSWKCREIATMLRDVERSLLDMVDELADSEDVVDLNSLIGEVRDTSNNLWLIGESLDRASEEEVIWVEGDQRGLSTLAVAPLNIGEELNRLLYPHLRTLILVSATLTVGEKFDYIKNRLGLDHIDKDRIREWLTPSPYDFEQNCRTLAVKNLAEPGSSQYARAVADTIKTIARNVPLRTMILFTSRSLLQQTARCLEGESEVADRLISQYQDGDYATLIAKLENRPNGILLGSDTFWEGVDLPGDMLNCLVLTRLPFRPPTEPLAEAWVEHLTRQGRNGFREYSLAEAVIRFRQGVGRLIRSETDSGALIILDHRFCLPPVGRSYSSLFRHSLPKHAVSEIGYQELEKELDKWFNKEGKAGKIS